MVNYFIDVILMNQIIKNKRAGCASRSEKVPDTTDEMLKAVFRVFQKTDIFIFAEIRKFSISTIKHLQNVEIISELFFLNLWCN